MRAAHQTKGPSGQPPPAPLAGRVLWVGNLPFQVRAGQMVDAFAAAAGVDARSVRCSLYLGCISAASRLHLGCISAASRLHLGCISAASRLHLGCISAASRLHLPGALQRGDGPPRPLARIRHRPSPSPSLALILALA